MTESKLAEAIKPFAELADSFSDTFSDKLKLSCEESNDGDISYAFTLGDLRRAAKALAAYSREQGEEFEHRPDCQLLTVPVYGLCTCDLDTRVTRATPSPQPTTDKSED